MLSMLLKLLDEGKIYSQKELAAKLGVSDNQISAQIEYLERLGVLNRVVPECGNAKGCKGCSNKCHNGGGSVPLFWEKVVQP